MHRGLTLSGNIGLRTNSVYDGKIAGLYDLEETLGRGHFAVVKLARHVFTGEKVAVKVIDKSKLDEVSRAHLFQEVRCMKLVQHPNVVRLYEVIDTQTKLYLILELGDGGDLYDYIMRHDSGLSEKLAREYFRQIVRAISYCHRLHVVHRDLKPENVVFFEKLGVVKLTDFGFSNKFCPGQKLETSCGSLAYSAPEILLGDSYDAPAVDVWSLGVILYMLVCGQAPFQEANDSETLTMIMDCKYTIPTHVSAGCKNLIGRMLIREPERRASLSQIACDQWLLEGAQETQSTEYLPLVSRHQVSDEDHNIIIQKMANGNIATKEEILEALDKNEYNHITATYFLLAERKLKAQRQEQAPHKRPEQLSVTPNKVIANRNSDIPNNNNTCPVPTMLSVPRTPGDLPQRARKCSIVQEEDDEEDLSSCSGREELAPPHCSLNRRGSRSEGKLNITVQERIAESERRREHKPSPPAVKQTVAAAEAARREHIKPAININDNWTKTGKAPLPDVHPKTIIKNETPKVVVSPATQPNKWRISSRSSVPENMLLPTNHASVTNTITLSDPSVVTTIITQSSTITIPIHTTTTFSTQVMPKYKTMPSPTRICSPALNHPQLTLNEIFEESDGSLDGAIRHTPRQFVSCNQTRTTGYEQRRSKFHKNRTASCSSSDASDDDSESRKKRAHKLNTGGKPLPGRRDSHDDSSDSQDPGGSGGSGMSGGSSGVSGQVNRCNEVTQGPTSAGTKAGSKTGNNTNTTGGRKNQSGQPVLFGRRHRAGRRRTGETRLRESQSLNRISEVQEDAQHSVVLATHLAPAQPVVCNASPKVKSLGARILQSWSLTSKKSPVQEEDKLLQMSQKNSSLKNTVVGEDNSANKITTTGPGKTKAKSEEKENCNKIVHEKGTSRKMRLLGKYFQVHKKICMPFPGLFGRSRLYKAQSCSSLVRDRITPTAVDSTAFCNGVVKNRPASMPRSAVTSDSDINQNLGLKSDSLSKNNGTVVQLNTVCSGIGGICTLHLGDASKCCSLC